ncbi:hypothetical protein HDV00_004561 [Rhizophlyctis rosea]|nr:hypothetical protein HDV00_004561 [Rhizophlyctis rosea]
MQPSYYFILATLLKHVVSAPTATHQVPYKPILLSGSNATEVVLLQPSGDAESIAITDLFEEWSGDYDRQYKDTTERSSRMGTFYGRVQAIAVHNNAYMAGQETWFQGLNDFSDLTDQEFAAYVTNQSPHPYHTLSSHDVSRRRRRQSTTAPSWDTSTLAMDWQLTMDGQVTSVKDQGPCNSCVAFATVATVESLTAISGGALVDLSPQQMIDCNPAPGNGGCQNYSDYQTGYTWLTQSSVALDPLSDYPWVGEWNQTLTCKKTPKSDGSIVVTAYRSAGAANNPDQMVEALKIQPGNFHLNIDQLGSYAGGIFAPANCTQSANHAVLATGYGVENGVKYWRFKNSWGPNFGENGYVRVQRGINMCGCENDGLVLPIGGRRELDSTQNKTLTSGEGLGSLNLKYRVLFGSDGILSVKPQTADTLWATSKTSSGTAPFTLTLSNTGTFTITDSTKKVTYQSTLDVSTTATGTYRMVLQDTGKLTVSNSAGTVVWSRP